MSRGRVGARALSALLTVLAAGCAAPTFREHGPRELEAGGGPAANALFRAWARPVIEVLPPEVLAGRPSRFRVVEHVARGPLWVLVLAPEAGEPVEVRYRVADGLRLPVEPDQVLYFNQSSQGAGLAVRDEHGVLRVLISVDQALSDLVALTVTPAFSPERLVYSEVAALPSGCMQALDHHELEVKHGTGRSFIPPGSSFALVVPSDTGGVAMRLFALDASRASPRAKDREDARCPAEAHVSWMLVQ